VLFILGLILVWLYLAGGPTVIYVFTIFVLMFGYAMAGPYSGYMKQVLWGMAEPISIGVKSLESASHDLWLLMTNPQEYMREQQMRQVRTETPTAYPRGAEFVSINLLPDYVPSNRSFYVQVRVENKGPVDLKHLSLVATPRDRCYGNEFNFSKESLRVGEQLVYEFGPFIAAAGKQQDIGRRSEVELTLHYCHEANSNLLVTVMSESEVWRRISNREMSFRLEVATAKATPAMIAMSVGEQPLIAGREATLLVSVVNKRPDGRVKLVKGSTLNITLPSDLLRIIDPRSPCKPSTQAKVNCSASGDTITCAWEEGETIEPSKYTSITCRLLTQPVEISKSGSITATLNGYLFELHQKVGPTIAQSNEFVGSGVEKVVSLGEPCYLCYSEFCGIWKGNSCTRESCHSLGKCIYNESSPTKKCVPCREQTLCEDYPDKEECTSDPCGIGKCAWNGTGCETCFDQRGGKLYDSRGNVRDAVFSKYLRAYDGNTTVYDKYYGEVYEKEINFQGCAYDEAELCMPFEMVGEYHSGNRNYVRCCNAAKCMSLEGYPDYTFIFGFTNLTENGVCFYEVSDANLVESCYNVNESCSDRRAISIETIRSIGLIGYPLFENYKTVAATCCMRKFCSEDNLSYYRLSSVNEVVIKDWYKMLTLSVVDATTPQGPGLILNNSLGSGPTYLITAGGLCAYVKEDCGSDKRCYGGGAWAGCCQPKVCKENAAYEINGTRLSDHARENEMISCNDYYDILLQKCGADEKCYGGGLWAGCCRPQKCIGNAVYTIDAARLSSEARVSENVSCDAYYVLKEECDIDETCVEKEDGTARCEPTQTTTTTTIA